MQTGDTDAKKNGKLSDVQIKRLNDLGFAWTKADERSWDSYFEDLLEYKLKHGHCKVPAAYSANKPLVAWVDRMRQLKVERGAGKKSNVLTDERFKMLNYFGFVWEGRKKRTSGDGEQDEVESPDKKRAKGSDDTDNSDVEMYEKAKASVRGSPSKNVPFVKDKAEKAGLDEKSAKQNPSEGGEEKSDKADNQKGTIDDEIADQDKEKVTDVNDKGKREDGGTAERDPSQDVKPVQSPRLEL
jgi:hypothetical protein